jgi:hypothetical protein
LEPVVVEMLRGFVRTSNCEEINVRKKNLELFMYPFRKSLYLDSLLKPGYKEMSTFASRNRLHTLYTVEENGSVSTLN